MYLYLFTSTAWKAAKSGQSVICILVYWVNLAVQGTDEALSRIST